MQYMSVVIIGVHTCIFTCAGYLNMLISICAEIICIYSCMQSLYTDICGAVPRAIAVHCQML